MKKYYDLITVGGGPAGICSAISAARQGLEVLLIEAEGCLGGMWTSGMLMYAMDTVGKKGIIEEISSELKKREAYYLEFPERGNFLYDSEAMKSVLDDLCRETNLEIVYYGRIINVTLDSNRIRSVNALILGRAYRLEAGLYIDATGNGDLGALCQCSYEIGHPSTGSMQPASLFAHITGVPEGINYEFTEEKKAAFHKLLTSLGFTPSYQAPAMLKLPFKEGHLLAITHLYGVDCTRPETLASALKEGRRQIFAAADVLKNQTGWEKVRVAAVSDYLGIREGLRLKGQYCITAKDIAEGRRYDDGICLVHAQVDIHALSAKDTNGYYDGNVKSQPFHIPYGSLVSCEVDNLGFAGRCISGDFYAHAAYRMTGNCAAMGEALGFAAALAKGANTDFASVDGREVAHYMKEQGYML